MLLTIHVEHAQAAELSYLLHKHPDKLQTFSIAGGKVHVYFPEYQADKIQFCLLLELDSIQLVRSLKVPGENLQLQHYVNDRPYVGSSFSSTAISKVLGSALNGRCENRPDLLEIEWPLTVELDVLKVKGGPAVIERIFQPLGYQIEWERLVLDPAFPDWGESAYYHLRLTHKLR
ncbi:MAG: 3' terminal RNA ribose 2'-O-methyltransferase Hen1, partial [Bacteroidota bacterium]